MPKLLPFLHFISKASLGWQLASVWFLIMSLLCLTERNLWILSRSCGMHLHLHPAIWKLVMRQADRNTKWLKCFAPGWQMTTSDGGGGGAQNPLRYVEMQHDTSVPSYTLIDSHIIRLKTTFLFCKVPPITCNASFMKWKMNAAITVNQYAP